ncbi:MAG: hypothetical protein KDF59_09325 [Nitrosomonas sp.]|nr:hypothetical protein [Nitrosomonas sp.]
MPNFTVIAIIGVILAGAGLFTYHTVTVSSLQSQIAELTIKITVLTTETNVLKEEKAILKNEIAKKNEEAVQIRVELEKFRIKDTQTQLQVADLEKKLKDVEFNERMQSIRNSRKASLLLNYANKNVKCEMENFEREGKCVKGIFKPTVQTSIEPDLNM